MAALDFAAVTTEVKNLLRDKGAVSTTTIQRLQNIAQRRISRIHDWSNLMAQDFVDTVAPINTGTVDVTADSAAVTENAGTPDWSSPDVTGRKFGLDYNSPWYQIASVSDADNFTLADTYRGATATNKNYVIYEDRVSMPSECAAVVGIWLFDTNRRLKLAHTTQDRLPHFGPAAEWGGYKRNDGKPYQFTQIENDSSGNMQIQVGPYAPDDNYRLQVIYKKDTTDDTASLLQDLEDAWIYWTLSLAYGRDNANLKRQAMAQAVEFMEDAWGDDQRVVEEFMVGSMAVYDHDDPAPFYVNYRSLGG